MCLCLRQAPWKLCVLLSSTHRHNVWQSSRLCLVCKYLHPFLAISSLVFAQREGNRCSVKSFSGRPGRGSCVGRLPGGWGPWCSEAAVLPSAAGHGLSTVLLVICGALCISSYCLQSRRCSRLGALVFGKWLYSRGKKRAVGKPVCLISHLSVLS